MGSTRRPSAGAKDSDAETQCHAAGSNKVTTPVNDVYACSTSTTTNDHLKRSALALSAYTCQALILSYDEP